MTKHSANHCNSNHHKSTPGIKSKKTAQPMGPSSYPARVPTLFKCTQNCLFLKMRTYAVKKWPPASWWIRAKKFFLFRKTDSTQASLMKMEGIHFLFKRRPISKIVKYFWRKWRETISYLCHQIDSTVAKISVNKVFKILRSLSLRPNQW